MYDVLRQVSVQPEPWPLRVVLVYTIQNTIIYLYNPVYGSGWTETSLYRKYSNKVVLNQNIFVKI